jgi:hypothetical protein
MKVVFVLYKNHKMKQSETHPLHILNHFPLHFISQVLRMPSSRLRQNVLSLICHLLSSTLLRACEYQPPRAPSPNLSLPQTPLQPSRNVKQKCYHPKQASISIHIAHKALAGEICSLSLCTAASNNAGNFADIHPDQQFADTIHTCTWMHYPTKPRA